MQSKKKRLGCQPRWLRQDMQTRWFAWCSGQFSKEPGLVSERCPTAFGTQPDPGWVDCEPDSAPVEQDDIRVSPEGRGFESLGCPQVAGWVAEGITGVSGP